MWVTEHTFPLLKRTVFLRTIQSTLIRDAYFLRLSWRLSLAN